MDWTTIITAAIVPTVLGLAGLIVGLRKARPDAAATLTGAALKMVENAQEESNEAKVEARAIRTEMQVLALNFHKLQREFAAEKERSEILERRLTEALGRVTHLEKELRNAYEVIAHHKQELTVDRDELTNLRELVQILQSRIDELETENAELKRRLGLQENK
jgi:chromosome segregation ATPase